MDSIISVPPGAASDPGRGNRKGNEWQGSAALLRGQAAMPQKLEGSVVCTEIP